MNYFAEKPFTINGVKSWFHCLDMHKDALPENTSILHHFHDYIEFLYVITPGVNLWINGKCHKLAVNDLAIINSKELHTTTFESKTNYICVKFSPQILYSDEQALFEFKYVIPFLTQNSHEKIFHREELESTDIHTLILEIMKEWNKKETGHELIIRANILKIFAGIFRYWHNNNSAISDIEYTDTIKKALKYIAENYNNVTEKDVADYCALSYTHLSSLFKKNMHSSFNDYVTALKLSEAEKLLISTNRSITEIAVDTGFSSASHFISSFKKKKHITPKQFRDSLKTEIQKLL